MPLFEHETPETIKGRILDRMSTSLQTREGSYTNDLAAPLAFELWRWCMTLDELVTAFYVDADSGGYLDQHATLLGLARKEGTRAFAVIRFTGRNGTIIPAGTVFLTPEGLEYTLVSSVTLADGAGEGYLKAAEVGDAYNAEAGEISHILRTISGLDSFRNEAAAGGTDPEGDADLFQRIDRRRKDPDVTGVSAAGTAIGVSATVVLEEGAAPAEVEAAFVSKLDTYLRELSFVGYTVYVSRIAALLMEVDGVTDYTELTVNGGTENVTIAETAVPVIGEVTLS